VVLRQSRYENLFYKGILSFPNTSLNVDRPRVSFIKRLFSIC
jgi:hypothetical protein